MRDVSGYFIIYTVNWQSYLQCTGNVCGNGSPLQLSGILKNNTANIKHMATVILIELDV
jgi:hypothetical protein